MGERALEGQVAGAPRRGPFGAIPVASWLALLLPFAWLAGAAARAGALGTAGASATASVGGAVAAALDRAVPGPPGAAGVVALLVAGIVIALANASWGIAAPVAAAALLFGSTAFLAALRPGPEALALAAGVAGLALVPGGFSAAFVRTSGAPAEVYEPATHGRGGVVIGRLVGAGLLLGTATALVPLAAWLLVPAAATILAGAAERRAAGFGALAAGALAGAVAIVAVAASLGVSPALAVAPVLDPHLLGWNLVYAFVGRTIGLLPYALPGFLAALACGDGNRAGAALVAVVGAVATAAIVHPFELAGSAAGALGPGALLAVYPALCLLPARDGRSAWAPLAGAALAAVFLTPAWLAPAAAARGDVAPSALAARFLPPETSQRRVAGGREAQVGALWVRTLGSAAWPESGGLRILGNATADLVVASPAPLSGLALVCDDRAPAEIEAPGLVQGDVVFRPDGGIGYELRMKAPRATHRAWWSTEPQHFHVLTVRLAKAAPVPIRCRLTPIEGGGSHG